MGYWNDVAAEIERVLGDELNPTDAYGKVISSRPKRMNTAQIVRGMARKSPVSGLITAKAVSVPIAYRSEEGDGTSVPIWDWGPPFPAPPGSERDKQNQRTGRAIQEWVDRWPWLPFGLPRTKETPAERERRCEEQVIKDEAICRKLRKRACWASANERYGACKAGKPLPPLVTW